jgi:hypothetical protein
VQEKCRKIIWISILFSNFSAPKRLFHPKIEKEYAI